MQHALDFYIGGAWVSPAAPGRAVDVVDPATEQTIATVAVGGQPDVDRAVAAARGAFESFSTTSVDDRLALLDRIIDQCRARGEDLATVISHEIGAPMWLARGAHVPAALSQLENARRTLAEYTWEHGNGSTLIVKEPIGVCALITPWNWPAMLIACKVAPALAAGCTMVLKPSELAPLNALVFAEIIDAAGVPPGVFNLVNGDGEGVGASLAAHPDVDMVSFTGSTRAGIEVARAAAPTVKRVAQELGGKSPNIVLDDADLSEVVSRDYRSLCINSGQTCNAPTRMLVPASRMDEAAEAAKAAALAIVVGDPSHESTEMGPVVSSRQFARIQGLIESGIAEGARVAAGGPGRPDDLATGFYVRPTVFSHVRNDMTIAREEVFGPVMVLIGYEDDDDAVRIANDSEYGLSGYVSGSLERAQAVARRIRSGQVHVNGAPVDDTAPFGGYKRSGNGREWGAHGFEEFLETKAVFVPAS